MAETRTKDKEDGAAEESDTHGHPAIVRRSCSVPLNASRSTTALGTPATGCWSNCQKYQAPHAPGTVGAETPKRSEEHTSELQSHSDLVCRLLLEKKNNIRTHP